MPRAGLPLLVLVALAVPLAAAQAPLTAPEVPLVELSIGPSEAPLRPLQDVQTLPMTARVSCALLDDKGQVPVSYKVEGQPRWATVVVSPTEDVKEPAACQEGWATFEAQLTVSASDQAPAFRAAPVNVSATAGSETGRAQVNVTASYFSIVDVQLQETSKATAPGTEAVFPLKLINFGNDRTRVSFEVVETSGGLHATAPEPLVLDSKQQGAPLVAADVELRVQAPEGSGYMNQVGTVTYRLTSASEERPDLAGDSSTVTVLVTTKGLATPAPAPVAWVAVAALAGVVARRLLSRP